VALVERAEVEAGVQVVTLNRPERRNALSGDLVVALLAALREAEADPAGRVVVLTGAGGTFCAGGDLAGGLGGAGGAVDAHRQRGVFADLLSALIRSPLAVVAAVEGAAMGGGLGVMAACDLVVAGASAKLGTPEIKLGLFPWIILAVLQRNVARKPLMELVLTGEPIRAPQAREIGLVNRVVDDGQALPEALGLARTIAARAPVSLALGKAAFQAVADQPLDDALRYLNGQLSLNLLTEDAMEGVAAFLQRRDPTWKGR
jgi:enoyl-CoA hydratase